MQKPSSLYELLRAVITNLLGLCWSQLLKYGQAGRWMEWGDFHFNIIGLNVLVKKSYSFSFPLRLNGSLLHLICAIARAHASTSTTILMHAKNNMYHFCLSHLLSGTVEWKKIDKEHHIQWLIAFFNLNVVLTCATSK